MGERYLLKHNRIAIGRVLFLVDDLVGDAGFLCIYARFAGGEGKEDKA
jgi:hypothetical protein